MNLKQVTVLHGVYIRISGDHGGQVGAHAEYVDRIIDADLPEGQQVLSATMRPPEPLDKGAAALEPLIGEIVIAQQTEIETLRAELEAAGQRERSLRDDLANLTSDHDHLQVMYGQLAAEFDERQVTILALQEAVTALSAQPAAGAPAEVDARA